LKPKYTVVLSRQAEHFYRKLEEKVKGQVRECLISLEAEAYSGKRLRGDLKGYNSLRVGKNLRVIYEVSERDKSCML
jgi:mRNA-degrading endonuclease RelE of RelBE toxin-antitoxin system